MTTKTKCKIAGDVVEGKKLPGLYMLMPRLAPKHSEEELALDAYIQADWTIDEFRSVAFMFACFTLLLNDDDNF